MTSAANQIEALPGESSAFAKRRITRAIDELFENMMLRELQESGSRAEANIALLNIELAFHHAMVLLNDMVGDFPKSAVQGANEAIMERVRVLADLAVSEISQTRLRSAVTSFLQIISLASRNGAASELAIALHNLGALLNERASEITFDDKFADEEMLNLDDSQICKIKTNPLLEIDETIKCKLNI